MCPYFITWKNYFKKTFQSILVGNLIKTQQGYTQNKWKIFIAHSCTRIQNKILVFFAWIVLPLLSLVH